MIKRIALILALACAPVFAQTFTSNTLQNSPGSYARVVPFAPVTICAASDLATPCTTRVTTYTDQTLSTQCTLLSSAIGAPTSGSGCNNPGISDANGNFSVFLIAGTYRACSYATNYQCIWFSISSSVNNNSGIAGQIAYYATNGTTISADRCTTDGSGNLSCNTFKTTGSGTGVVTFQTGAAPSAPASGFGAVYIDSGTLKLSCKLSNGSSCFPSSGLSDPGSNGIVKRTALNTTGIAASSDVISLWSGTCNSTTFLRGDGACATSSGLVTSVFGRTGAVVATLGDYTFDLIGSGTNTTATMAAGSGATVKPLNIGQIAGSQMWLEPGLTAISTVTFNNGGGTIGNAHLFNTQYTLNSALGESLPSVITANSNAGSCTASCTITISAPTIPSGYTGYTVYWCDFSGGAGCTAPVKVLACINISTSCTITSATLNSGVALPTVNTAWVQPPNVQANTTTLLAGMTPSVFFPKVDGNYYPWIAVDWNSCSGSTGPPLPCGTPTFIHRTYFYDDDVPASLSVGNTTGVTGKNAFVAIDHRWGSANVVNTNQDRALHVYAQNPTNDASTNWAFEVLQSEGVFSGNPTVGGHPDSEVTTGSFSMSDNHAGTYGYSGYGISAGRFLMGRSNTSAAYGSCTYCMAAIKAVMQNSVSGSAGGATFAGLDVSTNDAGGCSSCSMVAIHAGSPHLAGGNSRDLVLEDNGSAGFDYEVYAIATASETGRINLQGKTYLNHIQSIGPNNVVANPTCASTGTGTSPSCAVDTGSNDSMGTLVVTAGTTPGASGTITLTYNATYGTNSTNCVMMASNAGTGTWNARVSLIGGTQSTTSFVVNWDNNAVSLTGASTYKLNYWCTAK